MDLSLQLAVHDLLKNAYELVLGSLLAMKKLILVSSVNLSGFCNTNPFCLLL